jgi:biotin operon repressor
VFRDVLQQWEESQPQKDAPTAVEPEPPPNEEELLSAGSAVLDSSNQLALVEGEARFVGYAGETAPVKLVDLALCSRSLDRPINLVVEGPSAAGKSHTVEMGLRFHPEETAHQITGSSERALVYGNESLAHRYVIVAETTGLHHDGIGATIIRELAWGDRGLAYDTVDKTPDGELRSRRIVREGPTGLITTTTRPLDPELSTRLLRIPIQDTPEQTRAILRSLARQAKDGRCAIPDYGEWHAARRWLHHYGCKEVVIPFAEDLERRLPETDVRMRRDFTQILNVIRVHAFVHQRTRQRDERGRIIADSRDYTAAYELLTGVLAVTVDSVSDTIRQTVEAVAKLIKERAGAEQETRGISLAQLGAELGMTKQAAEYRFKKAREGGYLFNAEDRKGHPARILLGDPLPENRALLPEPKDLFSSAWPADVSRFYAQAQTTATEGDRPSNEVSGTRQASNEVSDGHVLHPKPFGSNGLGQGVKASGVRYRSGV